MKHKINSCKNRVRKIINMCGIIVTVLAMNTTAFAENYEYDELNRVTKVIYDDGSYVTYVYDNNGNVIDIIVYEIETETETDKETEKEITDNVEDTEKETTKENSKPVINESVNNNSSENNSLNNNSSGNNEETTSNNEVNKEDEKNKSN